MDTANVTEPIKKIVNLSARYLTVLMQPKCEGSNHFVSVVIMVVRTHCNLSVDVGQELVDRILLEEVVPEVFPGESVLLKGHGIHDDFTCGRGQIVKSGEDEVDLLRLVMVVVVDVYVAAMDDELVLYQRY